MQRRKPNSYTRRGYSGNLGSCNIVGGAMGSYSQERNKERMERASEKFLVDIFAIFAITRYCVRPYSPNILAIVSQKNPTITIPHNPLILPNAYTNSKPFPAHLMPVPFPPSPNRRRYISNLSLGGLACREARATDRNAANWNKTDHGEESKRHYCKFIALATQPKQPLNNLYHRGARFIHAA